MEDKQADQNATKTARTEASAKVKMRELLKSAAKVHRVSQASQSYQAHNPNTPTYSINDLYHHTVRMLTSSSSLIDCAPCRQSHIDTSLERQLGLVFMWAQGLNLQFLQAAVDHSTQLQAMIVRALAGIIKCVHILSNGMCYHPSITKLGLTT